MMLRTQSIISNPPIFPELLSKEGCMSLPAPPGAWSGGEIMGTQDDERTGSSAAVCTFGADPTRQSEPREPC